jgi:hypothetical protein
MWDLTPTADGADLVLSAEDAIRGSYYLNEATRARRGLPIVHGSVSADPADTLDSLQALLDLAEGSEEESLVTALRDKVDGALTLNVIPPAFFLSAMDRPVVQYACPGTESVACGTVVSPNSASRLRHHDTPQGAHCDRSNTPLTTAERDSGLIVPPPAATVGEQP